MCVYCLGIPNFYSPVEIIIRRQGRMDENENIESEMRQLFGITEDSNDSEVNASEGESSATDNQEQSSQTTGEETSSSGTEDAAPAPSTATETTANTETSTEDTPLIPEEKFNKQNSAFAQMRIQNKELSDLLMNLAKATGQNPKNVTEAQDILKDGLTKVVSKNRNIPEDILREMEDDKRKLAELQQTQAKQKALAGFQAVKDTFKLTRDEVNKFADKLIENNLNPFEQDVNLVKEYKDMYFEQLIAKAREEGVQEERTRSLNAQRNSTTPSTQKGLPENAGSQETPIKTIKDLDRLLDSLK